jgi:ABC-2 type transport system ATP-binding protein
MIPSPPSPDPALRVDGLRKSFDDVVAVDDVSFTVDAGTVVGVLGPNGAGKTTCVKAILGLVEPSAGTVHIAGVDVQEHPDEAHQYVGAMLEGARNVYWRLSPRENLRFFTALGGNDPNAASDRHEELLDRFDLTEKADDPVNDLSRGMKQKVALACTLARDVRVAALDEPTLGLDVESSVELRAELRRLADEEDVAVLLTSHDMRVIEDVCDRVVILNEGRVVADDPVEDLVSLFRTQAYRLTVADPVAEELRERLGERYDATNWTELGDRHRFDVVLDSGDVLYDLLGLLRESDTRLESVSAIEPDLEEAFLRLTGRLEAPDERSSVTIAEDSTVTLDELEANSGGNR